MYCGVGKYMSIRTFLKPIMDSFNPDFRTENIVSAKKARIE